MANQSSFGIMVDTVLNTKKAEQQIKNFTKDREIITKIKVTNPTSGEVETALKKVTTLVDQYGKKVKETSVIDLNGNKISSDVVSISDSFKTLNTQTNKYKDEMGAVVTEIKKFDQFGNSATTRIREYTDAQGYAVKETQQFNAVGEQVGETVKQMTRDLTKEESEVKKDTEAKKENSKATKEMSNSNKNLGQSFADIVAKVSKFYLATLPIQTMQRAISEAVETVKEFDNAMIEFRKVSDLSGESLQNYIDKLAKMGEITGSTMQAMVESSTEFKKSGFTDEDSAKLASIAEMYRNVADEEISAGESASFIISQMKAFNINADNAMHIIDAVNEVANNYAVSSADLANNLGKVSSALAVNGVTFEQQLGMLTAITEITRNASTATRGLTAISSRLVQVLDESSSTGKKLKAIYDDLGIVLTDEQGRLRGTFDILYDLSLQWNNLSSDQQKYIALTSAGQNQLKNFTALMKNFEVAINATETAMDSAGSAEKENEKVLDSISKKLSILQSEFQQLVIGEGGLQEFAKTILDIGIGLLKFANSDIGKVVISVTALGLGFKALYPTIMKTSESLAIHALMANGMTAENAKLIFSNMSLAQSFELVATTWLMTPMGMATVAVASIGLLAVAGSKATKTFEELADALNSTSDAYKQEKANTESLTQSLNDVRKQIEEINAQNGANITDEKQLDLLEKEEASLTRQLAIQKQKEESARRELAESAKGVATGQVQVTGEYRKAIGQDTDMMVQTTVAVERATKAYQEHKQKIDELNESSKQYIDVNGKVIEGKEEELDKINSEIEEYERQNEVIVENTSSYAEELNQASEALKGYDDTQSESLQNIVDGWLNVTTAKDEAQSSTDGVIEAQEEEQDAIDETIDRLQELADAHNVSVDDLKAWAKELGISEEELLGYADAMGVTVEQAYRYQSSIKSWNNSIDSLQSAYGTLTSAVEEYNSSNGFTLDTLQSLLSLSPEYLGMLTEENGKLKLNEQAIINKANALIEERKQTALQIATDKLRAIEIGNSASAEVDHKIKVENNTEAIKNETLALEDNVRAYGRKIIVESQGRKKSAVDQVLKELEQELAMIDKIGNGYGKVTTSAIKAGNAGKSSSKGATDALKEQNKELEKLKSNYDKVASYITSSLDKKIKAIQKEKDSALDAIETEIKGIERKKDSALNAIEETIKAREKEKDTALKNIEAQIKAIEKEKDARLGDLKSQKKQLQDAQDKELDSIQTKIDLLSEEKEAIVDATQTEIDALKELKEEREKYWDAQIDALKEANEQRKDSLELQEKLDALEKARNTKVKVYKKGEGFVYDVDQTKVAEAQKALDEYLSEKAYEDELERLENLKKAEIDNYADRIDALTKFKDEQSKNYQAQIDELTKLKNERKKIYDEEINALSELIDSEQEKYDNQLNILEEQKENLTEYYSTMLEELKEYKENVQQSYEEQISALEEHKDALGKNYDQEIEYYQNYKDKFEEMVNAYEDQQNKLLFAQLTGLSAENDNWMTRLDNLAKFVNEYNKLKSQLDSGTTSATSNYNGTSTVKKTTVTTKPSKVTANPNYAKGSTAGMPDYAKKYAGIPTYASGISSVKDNEVAIVGEDPNKELVIGSKVNNGRLMSLSKGSGVVNAKSTKSMAGLLNQIGSFGGSSFGAGNGTLNNTTNNDTFTINGVTVNGANITDAQSFATALMNLKSEAIQRAYNRSK